jgi:hypothetical protein
VNIVQDEVDARMTLRNGVKLFAERLCAHGSVGTMRATLLACKQRAMQVQQQGRCGVCAAVDAKPR